MTTTHASVGGTAMLDNDLLYRGVLSRRFMAFLFDATVIVTLTLLGWALFAVLGIITFGLAWLALGLVFPFVALGYSAFTLGGPASATWGMRLMGLEMRRWDGERMYALLAGVHALFFWASVTVLTPLILLVALFDRRRRLLHDLFLGTMVINSHHAAQHLATRNSSA